MYSFSLLGPLPWGPGPRVACPSGNLFKANSSPHPEQDDLMTVGQCWDRQVPFPTDLCPSQRTKTKPRVPYLTSVPRRQLGVRAT